MKVELFRMASEPMTIEVEGEEATIKQILSAPLRSGWQAGMT